MLMLPMQRAHTSFSPFESGHFTGRHTDGEKDREGGRRLAWLTAVAICVDIHNKAHQSSSEAAHSLD